MPAYKVTYYTMSDGHGEMITNAASPAEAEAIARQRDELFAQLKQVQYIGDTMTTPTTNPASDKITPAELRQQFDNLHAEIDSIRHDLETLINAVGTITAGIQHAATATPPVPAASVQFAEMEITAIVKMIDKNNKINYLAVGAPYSKFGVRIWDEIIPMIGIDPAALEFGNNPITPAIRARVLMGETKNRETGAVGIGPHKVTGKA